MKETVIESPLIGSGSAEEAERRVNTLLEMGTSRGYLTYEELNNKLPDEVVSPDKLDCLLMMIDEMGIKLIDEHDVGGIHRQAARRRQEGESHRPGQRHRHPQPAARPLPCRPKMNRRWTRTRTKRKSTSTSKRNWPRLRPSASTIRSACT